MTTVNVRYIVRDVEEAIAFYTAHLGFEVQMHPGPGFASLAYGDLRLLLNAKSGSGGRPKRCPMAVARSLGAGTVSRSKSLIFPRWLSSSNQRSAFP